jgi:hypothetical protein
MERCGSCEFWEFRSSDFDKPEGQRMTGWCSFHNKCFNQSYHCDNYSKRKKTKKKDVYFGSKEKML